MSYPGFLVRFILFLGKKTDEKKTDEKKTDEKKT